ncbi:MAG TPA: hypothetical protein VLK33_22950 [Terriglobales bacterium]|nr:hypothetical protein [Terriglobales bacterium]
MDTKLSDKARLAIGFIFFVLTLVDMPIIWVYLQRLNPDNPTQGVLELTVMAVVSIPLLILAYIIVLLDVRRQSGKSIQAQLSLHLKQLWHECESILPIFRWSWRYLYLSCVFALCNMFTRMDDLSPEIIGQIFQQALTINAVIFIVFGLIWFMVKSVWKIRRDGLLMQAVTAEGE